MYEASQLSPNGEPDVVCFSHLRWDFVYQRPQHLLSRAAQTRRVFFIEEPVFDDGSMYLELSQRDCGVWVGVPHLPEGLQSSVALEAVQRGMIDRLFRERAVREYVAWYYTPMALSFTHSLRPLATIYDCMDELSAFKDAPPTLGERERELFKRADLIFTGGQSLYEVKREHHHAVYAFPSSIDYPHFAQARGIAAEPEDQRSIPHPRLGFFGVIDERLDLELLDGLAAARPDWHIVMVGPVVKIDPATLPRRPNIHYLGGKSYTDLPAYLAGWDAALLLFARNDSTRFISPTKTPEYLAAGKPVVSTSIRDVARPYEDLGMVRIADATGDFVEAVEAALSEPPHRRSEWLARVDEFLAHTSWDKTWEQMSQLIENAVSARRAFIASAQQGVAAKIRVAGAAASQIS
ncbi:MAG: glycosyltransferase family 1 protein [Acidobacteriota bacterium]|nr:glycosyltransferase family 1 protein [Acidobacteriota bacterium]